jgi:alpha-L-fucosidase
LSVGFELVAFGGGSDPDVFAPTDLDVDQWLDAAVSARCRYVHFNAKFQTGFAMWPTAYHVDGYDPFSIAQSQWYADNGSPDILGLVVAGCRTRGLKPVLYYSILDQNWEAQTGTNETTNAAGYIAMIEAQLTELLTNYGDITAIWTDGWKWEMGYEEIPYATIYNHIKSIQPDCLLIENNHEHPAVNSEIELYETPVGGDGAIPAGNTRLSEEIQPIRTDNHWVYYPADSQADAAIRSAASIAAAITNANANSATYLIAAYADTTGQLPAAIVTRLGQVGAYFS